MCEMSYITVRIEKVTAVTLGVQSGRLILSDFKVRLEEKKM